MTAFNVVVDRAFDFLFAPLVGLPIVVSLLLISLVTAVAVLLVVRHASDQSALDEIKRQIQADLLEIRLFNDDMVAMLRAQTAILRHNATYLRLSLASMLWMLVPLVLLLAQLDAYFGYAGVPLRRPVAVTAQLNAGGGDPAASLDVPNGVRVHTPPIWLPGLRQVVWLVSVDAPGSYLLTVRVGGEAYTKTLEASDRPARRSLARTTGFVDQLLYPSEAPLPSTSPVTSISVAYDARVVKIFGLQSGWLIVYLLASAIFALLLRAPLRVTL